MESKVVISRPLKLQNAGNETEIQEHRVLQRKKNRYYEWNEIQEKVRTKHWNAGVLEVTVNHRGLARSQTLALSLLAATQGSERSPLCKKTPTRFEGQTVIKLGNGLFSRNTAQVMVKFSRYYRLIKAIEALIVLFICFSYTGIAFSL